jgi:hypothetical protein
MKLNCLATPPLFGSQEIRQSTLQSGNTFKPNCLETAIEEIIGAGHRFGTQIEPDFRPALHLRRPQECRRIPNIAAFTRGVKPTLLIRDSTPAIDAQMRSGELFDVN